MDEPTYPHRPRRLALRFQRLEPLYFVTFNTYARQPCLASPVVQDAFRCFAGVAQTKGVIVGRYVIMPDHVHLFVKMPPEGMTLGRWVQMLKTVLGKTLLGQGHHKPHWQDGFFDHLLRSDESYAQKWDYVRQNPVRKQLVANADEWPFQGEICPIMWKAM